MANKGHKTLAKKSHKTPRQLNITLEAKPNPIEQGGRVRLNVTAELPGGGGQLDLEALGCEFFCDEEPLSVTRDFKKKNIFYWDTKGLINSVYTLKVVVTEPGATPDKPLSQGSKSEDIEIRLPQAIVAAPDTRGDMGRIEVGLQPAAHAFTRDELFWALLQYNAKRLSFDNYARYLGVSFGGDSRESHGTSPGVPEWVATWRLHGGHPLHNNSYELLKWGTEAFLMENIASVQSIDKLADEVDLEELKHRLGVPPGLSKEQAAARLKDEWNIYLDSVMGDPKLEVLPYLALIQKRLPDVHLTPEQSRELKSEEVEKRLWDIREKLTHPVFIELIWSYWHEEGMLAQTMNLISRRFQNLRADGKDPLADIEVDPLRPLSDLLWGYVQDEQHRLSVIRRASEYENEYGFTLHGKAVAELRSVERRSRFLESFHALLAQCIRFFAEDAHTTVVANSFPLLNCLKDTHFVLAQGAHNQFGALTTIARQEMLMQQWILSRPEVREFLGGRVMVPYPEPWMDRVDAMKNIQGWSDVSVLQFHDLAVFGEQLLLSIRYGAWSKVLDAGHAANWARFWRAEIQGYIHAYHAVTGVDLAAPTIDVQGVAERNLPPSVHLRNRLATQRQH